MSQQHQALKPKCMYVCISSIEKESEKMTRLPFFFLSATFFFFSSSTAEQLLHSRHLLHQPFFPVISTAPPPSEPPSPSPHTHHHHKKHSATPPQHEKHPFSSFANTSPPPPSPPHPNPFFPSSTTSHPPPPPPHPSSLQTFPANISSLLFPPHNNPSKPHHNHNISKLVVITASVISAASLLSLFAVFIIFLRRTRHRRRSSPAYDTKSTRSDSLQLFKATPSDKQQLQPPKYTSSNPSSEFLYLGTLANSGLDQRKSPISVTGVLELPAPASSSSYSQYHKLGSPELRPLPPLPKLPMFTPTYKSSEQLNPKRQDFDGDDYENEEFFSPRGSSGRKLSPTRVYASLMKDSGVDQIGSSSINGSNSPTNSVSSLNGYPVTSLKCKLNDSVLKQLGPARPTPPPPPEQLCEQEHQFLDRKFHNIAMLLRALNVTVDQVCEALVEGNSDTLGPELLECLLKMAPTKQKEDKLNELKDDDESLGLAEKFLKALLNIPLAFKRIDAMLYVVNFESETEYLKRSFDTLEAACGELKNTRMFLMLLEAILKTGNQMNIGTTRGSKLDTLLKLVDIKGADGKTSLLHFVVQEIIKTEGARVAQVSSTPNQSPSVEQSAFQDELVLKKLGLQVVSGLSSQLINVKKAAAMDSNSLSNEMEEIARGITKVKEVIAELKHETSAERFLDAMNSFLNKAEKEITEIQSHESNVLKMVREVTEYFHGSLEAQPFRIFSIVRDLLTILDQVCKEVGRVNERTTVYGSVPLHSPSNQTVTPLFPVVNSKDSRLSHSGSLDDEEDSF